MTVDTFAPAAPPAAQPVTAVESIVAWAHNLATAADAITHIVDTPFMPVSFWPLPPGVQIRDFPNPAMKHPRETDDEHARRRQVAIASGSCAVVTGHELGLTPQASLASVYVVRGKPGLYAEAMAALVKSHGHQIQVEQLDPRVCRIRGRRRGEEEWQRFEFSIERARQAGYAGQNKKYSDDPQAMLYARCLSIACRSIAPEVLKGLPSVDELEDEPSTEQAAGRARTVQRAPQAPALPAAPAPAPARTGPAAPVAQRPAPAAQQAVREDLPPLPDENEPIATGRIDERAWREINASFVGLGVTGPGQSARRLRAIGVIIGHDVAKGSDLTADEGGHVLAALGKQDRKTILTLTEEPRDVVDDQGVTVDTTTGEVFDDVDEVAAQFRAEQERRAAQAADAEAYDPTAEQSWGDPA